MHWRFWLVVFALSVMCITGCAVPRINLFGDDTEPLREFTLQGEKPGKVLVVSVKGTITETPKERLYSTRPSVVQEIVSQLRLAETDSDIKAVVLKIDSPGGTTTASDILYHELIEFQKKTGVKLVAALMGMATSGGYYIALPADYILAHPTTVTGSVGAIFFRPRVTGLMEKIGVSVSVNKSGKNKDIGSPFRKSTEEENGILQAVIDFQGRRFLDLVKQHRPVDEQVLSQVATARVYMADEARAIGLIDQVGYLADAIGKAKTLAGLDQQARVVVYRRTEYPDDNLYNTLMSQREGAGQPLVRLGPLESLTEWPAGFYYLWAPAAGMD